MVLIQGGGKGREIGWPAILWYSDMTKSVIKLMNHHHKEYKVSTLHILSVLEWIQKPGPHLSEFHLNCYPLVMTSHPASEYSGSVLAVACFICSVIGFRSFM